MFSESSNQRMMVIGVYLASCGTLWEWLGIITWKNWLLSSLLFLGLIFVSIPVSNPKSVNSRLSSMSLRDVYFWALTHIVVVLISYTNG